jgi:cytidine deaminase
MTRARSDQGLDALIKAAKEARTRAYAPYSRYKVGAAIRTRSGAMFAGCNVENASYGACLCAERNAIGQMVAAGEAAPTTCVVVTGGPHAGSPCGICRQVLAELAKDMRVVLIAEAESGRETERRETTLAALLPDAFAGSSLPKSRKVRAAIRRPIPKKDRP